MEKRPIYKQPPLSFDWEIPYWLEDELPLPGDPYRDQDLIPDATVFDYYQLPQQPLPSREIQAYALIHRAMVRVDRPVLMPEAGQADTTISLAQLMEISESVDDSSERKNQRLLGILAAVREADDFSGLHDLGVLAVVNPQLSMLNILETALATELPLDDATIEGAIDEQTQWRHRGSFLLTSTAAGDFQKYLAITQVSSARDLLQCIILESNNEEHVRSTAQRYKAAYDNKIASYGWASEFRLSMLAQTSECVATVRWYYALLDTIRDVSIELSQITDGYNPPALPA